MTCPFCIPSVNKAIFANSEHFLAVYNHAPILPGHSLIIPREHICSILELSDPELSDMMIFTRKVTNLLLSAFGVDAFNWSVQEKEAAGESVAHLHLHIVPRYPGDLTEPGDWYPKIKSNYNEILDSEKRKKLSHDELHQIIKQLRILAEERQLFNSD